MMLSINHRAFTLVELTVSLAMFTIIALGLQSAVLVASKAIPDAKNPNAKLLDGGRAVDRLTSELTYALSVSELTSTAVTFTVADRDHDGSPETIRYAWSGVSGDPLTRQYNNGTAASVIDDVREFSLAFDKRSQKNSATYTESAESILYSFSGGLLSSANTVDNSGDWCGQYFVPTLPSGITYWRVTHVRYQAQKHSGSNGETRVQLRTATSGGLPTTTVLDQTPLLENTLNGSFSATDSYFTGSATLSPSSGACIVFRWVSDNESCDIQSKTLGLSSGAKFLTTGNSGSTWSGNVLSSMPLQVYGVSATQNADTYSYSLTGVRVMLRSGSDSTARANGAAQVFSQPQVSGP